MGEEVRREGGGGGKEGGREGGGGGKEEGKVGKEVRRKGRWGRLGRGNRRYRLNITFNSLSFFPVVEKIAGFNVPVNDVMEVDIGKSRKQCAHVISRLSQSHEGKEVLTTR